ncbi:hypothetical protein QR680_000281 [Steinernema hermaphroditum]|uniref:C2H2-type domain-containing protein n=1 Tax=Steinernema hermaphroditum TaxID=289476 RepID=A0AA39GUU6_9BILA|nr:hypothetical protein QR680_000281 [Steinernema hermaphroditum]
MKRRSSAARTADLSAGKTHQETPPPKRSKGVRQEAASDRPQRRQRRPPARHSDYVIPGSARGRYDEAPPARPEPELQEDDDDDDDDGPPKLEPQLPTEMPPSTSKRAKSAVEHNDEEKNEPQKDVQEEDEEVEHTPTGSRRGRPSKGKTGSFMYCQECPFSTRHRERYSKHCKNHERTSGFKCPLCSFMSTSSGFLKRHCDGHGKDYKWPPEYVAGDESKNNSKDETMEDEMEENEEGSPESPELNIKQRPRRSAPAKLNTDFVETNDDDDEPSFACPVESCSFASNFKRSLNRHIKNKHDELPNHSLDQETPASTKPDTPQETPQLDPEQPTSLKKYADLVKKLEEAAEPKSPASLKEESTQPSDANKKTFRLDKCPYCPYASRFKCDVKAHIELHQGKREFACSRCSYSTIVQRALKNHMEMHDRHDRETVGEAESKEPKKIAAVLEDQTDKVIGKVFLDNGGIHRFYCEVCKTNEASYEIYDEHTRQHTDNEVFYSCPQCEFRTQDGQLIIDHADNHPEPPDLPPVLVRAENPAPKPLLEPPREQPKRRGRPRKEETIAKQALQKAEKEKEKAVKAEWKPPMRKGKKGDEPVIKKCSQCPFQSEQEPLYQLHLEMHIGRRPFKCPDCSYSCFSPSAIESHKLLHSGEPPLKRSPDAPQKKTTNGVKSGFECRQCDHKAADFRAFEAHHQEHAREMREKVVKMTEHSREIREARKKEAEMRKLAELNKPTAQPVGVKRPIVRLTFSCVKCAFNSVRADTYAQHLERHGDTSRPLKCSVCDFHEDTQQLITTHEQEHHAKGTIPKTHCYRHPQFLAAPDDIKSKEDLWNQLRDLKKRIFCKKCDFNCFDLKQLVEHCEQAHVESAEDRQDLEELKSSIVIRSSVNMV